MVLAISVASHVLVDRRPAIPWVATEVGLAGCMVHVACCLLTCSMLLVPQCSVRLTVHVAVTATDRRTLQRHSPPRKKNESSVRTAIFRVSLSGMSVRTGNQD